MEKRLIIAVCALFFAMGSLFITQGMTGMYSWDRFDDYCTSDSQCSTGKLCCLFFEEEYGVCGGATECSPIWQATMEEKNQMSNLNGPELAPARDLLLEAAKPHLENPATGNSKNSIIVGLILVAFAIGVYFFTNKHFKPIAAVRKRKHRA